MFLRIFLFGSAVVGVLVAALVWAVISGQYEAAQPGPSASVAGSGEPAASSSPAGSAAASASAVASPSAGASGAVTMVEILNSHFGPDLTVAVGATVMWMNGDGFAHTATEGSNGVAAPDALFDLQLAAGASDSYTFAEAGTYEVTCTLHPNMNMTVTVQ
jgi:plastocyanin